MDSRRAFARVERITHRIAEKVSTAKTPFMGQGEGEICIRLRQKPTINFRVGHGLRQEFLEIRLL